MPWGHFHSDTCHQSHHWTRSATSLLNLAAVAQPSVRSERDILHGAGPKGTLAYTLLKLDLLDWISPLLTRCESHVHTRVHQLLSSTSLQSQKSPSVCSCCPALFVLQMFLRILCCTSFDLSPELDLFHPVSPLDAKVPWGWIGLRPSSQTYSKQLWMGDCLCWWLARGCPFSKPNVFC